MKFSRKDEQKNEQIGRLWQILKNKVVEDVSYPFKSISRFTISANTFNKANPMADRLNKDMSILMEMNWIQLLDNQTILDANKNLVISSNRIYGLLPDGRRAIHLNDSDFSANVRRHLEEKEQDEWNEKWKAIWNPYIVAIIGAIAGAIIVWLVS